MKSAEKYSTHSAANDVILSALRSAEVPSIREPIGCSRDGGKRPDGLTLVPWKRGKPLVWDFTCRNTFAPSCINVRSRHPGYAAEIGETDKKKFHDFLNHRFILVSLTLESSGVCRKDGLILIKDIGRRI